LLLDVGVCLIERILRDLFEVELGATVSVRGLELLKLGLLGLVSGRVENVEDSVSATHEVRVVGVDVGVLDHD